MAPFFKMMETALAKWEKLTPAERLLPKDVLSQPAEQERRKEANYPKDGLVLHAYFRDLPRAPGKTNPSMESRGKDWNADFAWFRKDEARAWLPAKPTKGAKQEVCRDLVERLACCHFVDVVRGHNSPFPRKAIAQAGITAEVVDAKGHFVSLRYKGRTRTSEVHDGMHMEGKWNAKGPGIPEPQTRGIDATIDGQAVYDRKAEKFVSFELLVLCQRWGGNAYNARLQYLDFGPAPMGIVLRLAGGSPAEQVPPMFFNSYGWK